MTNQFADKVLFRWQDDLLTSWQDRSYRVDIRQAHSSGEWFVSDTYPRHYLLLTLDIPAPGRQCSIA